MIRLDTNQGLSGYGEVRDVASKPLRSCSRAACRREPLQRGQALPQDQAVWPPWPAGRRRLRRGDGPDGPGRQSLWRAGLCARRREVPRPLRMYCDTPNEPTGEAMGQKLGAAGRGFTMLKMDLGVQPLIGVKGRSAGRRGCCRATPDDKWSACSISRT